ncbi:hypothetical protein niasHT_019867 [Heterodera trifolii]|uniref:Lon proteolytic domain-containing protein n=1 Tax=Heterodera trifolii TaxID=157864 RepID=A0ABD2L508_9BILA
MFGKSGSAAILIALYALASGLFVKKNIAVSAVIRKNKQIGKVGGLRYKVMAAAKARKSTVVLSTENKTEFMKFEKKVKKSVKGEYVRDAAGLIRAMLEER